MAVLKLRFKDETWKILKLNQLFAKITLKNKGNTITNVISNSAQYGLVSQRDFFYKDIANSDNTEGYFIIENNDFVYNPRKSNEAPYGPFNQYKLDEVGIVSPLYTCLRPKGAANSEYLKHYFSSPAWHKYMYANGNTGVRHDRVSITDDILMKMPVAIPNEQEQKKIADFLTTFDKRITAQQNIIADMEEIKKGLLQKIFSQEIRFKDDDGKDYLEWEKLQICELGDFYGGLSGKNKDDFGHGNGKFITYKSVYLNTFVKKESLENVDISDNEKQNMVAYGDVLFTISSETFEEVGLSSVYLYNDNPYLNSFCNGFRLRHLEKVNPICLGYIFRSPKIRRAIIREGQGISRINISTKRLSNIEIELPCLEEQNKIASFLSTYDKKIEAEKKILADLQELKKGLLQQMFV